MKFPLLYLGDNIDVVGENQQQLKTINLLQTESTMSLSSIREKLKKKPVTKAKRKSS